MSEDRVESIKEFVHTDLAEEGIKLSVKDIKQFWQSPNTIRLRHFGFLIMRKFYKNESFDLDKRLTGRELLTLRDNVGWPYFLPANHTHIVLFTVKQSFVLKLNGGDVKKWLKNLENKTP
jgi:hypothetical protein